MNLSDRRPANRIRDVFSKPRVLLPVVHCIDEKQACASVELAFDSDADGVFLIDQGGLDAVTVAAIAGYLREFYVDKFIGVNMLAFRPVRALGHVADRGISGLWVDDAGVETRRGTASTGPVIESVYSERERLGWQGLYFGGVAFKYRDVVPPALFGDVARLAGSRGVDVVTTSGPATGSPPDVAKVRAMREAIGDHALAIASGVTPENVEGFMPYVDAFLVATGIEREFGWFDPAKVKALADRIHAYRPSTAC